jgi:predicted DNA-binding antitoxin AbrB/MazE fold protein
MVRQDPNSRTQITEAIYDGGVLRPAERLNLRDHQRVRLIVQSLDTPNSQDRAAAVARLRTGVAGMNFTSTNGYPSRDALHERG